jgi:hypothetical protein
VHGSERILHGDSSEKIAIKKYKIRGPDFIHGLQFPLRERFPDKMEVPVSVFFC